MINLLSVSNVFLFFFVHKYCQQSDNDSLPPILTETKNFKKCQFSLVLCLSQIVRSVTFFFSRFIYLSLSVCVCVCVCEKILLLKENSCFCRVDDFFFKFNFKETSKMQIMQRF